MGLISTEVELQLSGGTITRYESLGYEIPRSKDSYGRLRVEKNTTIKVRVSDLQPKSNVKITYVCDNCGKKREIKYCNYTSSVKADGSIYCNNCAKKLYGSELARLSQVNNGLSFEQWCINNNRNDILERWDYNLNKHNPNEIGCSSKIKIWFKCPNGIHKSEKKNISLITQGWKGSVSCIACNSIGQWLINIYGNNALNIYWSNKNTINPFEITHGSNTKIWLTCQNCGNDKKIRFSDFINYGLSCNKCSDGISYPNKLAFNMLDQLGINFKTEYSPSWIKPKRYDFYFELKSNKYILEMDGGLGHGNENKRARQTKEETKAIDDYKDKLAKEHNIAVIRIDCKKSELSYIKTNLINSQVSKLFDLSKVNWNKCNEYAYSSLVRTCCDMWNNGLANVSQIANELKINKHTVNKYLKQGVELGWCDYNPEYELAKNFKNMSKKVYCYELDRIFNSTMDVERTLGIFNTNISACCLGKKNQATAGGYHWIYYEDYLELNKTIE